jgi:hypothetical protein
MYNKELYDLIYKGDINNSLYQITKIILENGTNNIEIIENTFISICSYIGSFISIYDIRLWIDVVEETYQFINSDNIVIKNIYILITKLCIVCDINIKKPVSKSGFLTIAKLREKIIDIFNNSKSDIDYTLVKRYDDIIPPANSETYDISKLIIASITNILNEVENLNMEKINEKEICFELANKLKDIFDYISRKTYKFETKFYHLDSDSMWYMWGLYIITYNDEFANIVYNLFLRNYAKKMKLDRLGLLWGASITLIYNMKKDIARVWNKDEAILIRKINDISMDMYKYIKKDINKNLNIDDEDENIYKKPNSLDGLEILRNYVPVINDKLSLQYNETHIDNNIDETKKIRYDKK